MSSSSAPLVGFDSSLLIGYYNAKVYSNLSRATSATAAQSGAAAATPKSTLTPPWDSSIATPSDQTLDAQAMADTPYLDLSGVSKYANTPGQKLDQDNQKLFALYQGLNRLAYLASMATRDGMTSGQLAGLNTRFQDGLSQIQDFLSTTTFNGLTLLPGAKSSSIVSTATVPLAQTSYVGGVVVKGDALFQPVPKLSTSDSFTISVTKGGTTTNLDIDLSQVSGPLTLDNISSYINQQLTNAGFATRINRTVISDGSQDQQATSTGSTNSTSGTTGTDAKTAADTDPLSKKTFGLQIKTSGSEKISFSAASAQPAIYLAGTSGTVADANQTGRLIKLGNLSTSPQAAFNTAITPDSGTSTAQSTVVDANGNVYVVGNTTGSFGGQIEKGDQDVYLTKYDSAGNVQWTRLLGSETTASGYSLALDPTGGVVVAGSTTSPLSQDAIGGGTDSFVAKYTADGTQKWLHQIDPVSSDTALAVTVDASGNVYYGGQVNGAIASGQTRVGGLDGYITKLDNKGAVVYHQQIGTAATDQVSQMATTADGGLVVASVQNGHAIVAKYAAGDATGTPSWQMDLGDLQNGTLGGIAVDGNNVYVSGTTSNASLTAGGQASVANASSGSSDAFVFSLTDSGASVSANFVSYVGTSTSDQGGAIAVANGHVYLTGTTRGQFAGQTQSFANTPNMFVTDMSTNGTINWTRQYGGLSGNSSGSGIAVDSQGSSVLDALGLPRGNVSLSQSVNLVDQTTVHAGDSFKLKISGRTEREVTIRIEADETMSSLATKINTALMFDGTSKVTYSTKGSALQISANAGVQIQLESGPDGSDALAGLGIEPTVLAKDAASSAKKTSSASSSTQKLVAGLGLTSTMDLSTVAGAKAARGTMVAVLSSLRTAYRNLNTPVTTASAATGANSGGTVSAYQRNQIANYNLALSMLGGGTQA
jgi:hypothetical protein